MKVRDVLNASAVKAGCWTGSVVRIGSLFTRTSRAASLSPGIHA